MSKCVFAAVTAAGLCVAASSALAQDASTATHGGDVTADEATPLPPVVVQAPSEPPRRTRAKRQVTPASTGAPAAPGESDLPGTVVVEGPAVAPFTLGQLDMIGGSAITNEAMWTYNKQSLDKAVSLLPGVTIHTAGNSRNEGDIYVRGFDRLHVPLYIDGVRINLPYDNRLDMSRFLTPDLAEVQVQKGYVSVLNGPGGMGGAINMVSRKPTKELELEGRSGIVMNGDVSDMNQWSSYAYAGTRQKGYYAQISGTIVDQDHFNLSDDFSPSQYATPGPGHVALFPYEQGGDRDFSSFQDWRVNAKIGLTPNATDEYSVNYTYQHSAKEAPLHVDRQIVQGYFSGTNPRYWNWPEWNISTLSWLSKTQIGQASYIKTNAYYNTFDNIVEFFRQPTATTPEPFTFLLQDSPYDDHSVGGFVEMGTELIPMNTLKGSIHYRRDVHTERGRNYNAAGVFTGYGAYSERSEETWSFNVENTFHATRNLDLVTGLGYDTNEVLRADGSVVALPELDAWNWQGAAIYSYSRDGKVHASVSSRTRFPTLFDRYSSRFGSRSEQPNLEAERSTNYEIGISDRLFGSLQLSSAVFYSDIQDTIQTAFSGANGNGSLVVFNADGEHYGFEMSADWDVTRTLRIGANYTLLERDYDFASATVPPVAAPGQLLPTQPQLDAIYASKTEGTPRHSAFLYASWKPLSQLTLTPSLEIASNRKAIVTSCASTLVDPSSGNEANSGLCPTPGNFTGKPSYVNIGAYALFNFQAEYAFNDNATLTLGAMNILDENYSLAEGFPQPGRQFFANARVRF